MSVLRALAVCVPARLGLRTIVSLSAESSSVVADRPQHEAVKAEDEGKRSPEFRHTTTRTLISCSLKSDDATLAMAALALLVARLFGLA